MYQLIGMEGIYNNDANVINKYIFNYEQCQRTKQFSQKVVKNDMTLNINVFKQQYLHLKPESQ